MNYGNNSLDRSKREKTMAWLVAFPGSARSEKIDKAADGTNHANFQSSSIFLSQCGMQAIMKSCFVKKPERDDVQ